MNSSHHQQEQEESTEPPQLSDEQEEIVELIQPQLSNDGKPSLSVVAKNLAKGALIKTVPFGDFVLTVIEEIESVDKDRLANEGHAKELLVDVQYCRDTIQDTLDALISDKESHDRYKNIVSDFVDLLDCILKDCRKWNKKGFFKQFRGALKYEGIFLNHGKELKRYKENLLFKISSLPIVMAEQASDNLNKVVLSKVEDLNTCQGKPPKSILPESPILYYGRKVEMTQLYQTLDSGGRMAALVGGAGMGKTHCASHHAHDWVSQDPVNRLVLWLEAETENSVRVSYLNALEALGGALPDTGEEMGVRDIAGLVWEKLRILPTQFEWMVVYNNVPEVLGDLEGPEAFSLLFFPTPLRNWRRGRILLTTRCTSYEGRIENLGNHHVGEIVVDPVDESTAVKMLIDDEDCTLLSESEMVAAKELVKMFGYMALAVVTAKSQMVVESLSIFEYVEDLKNGLIESDVHDAVTLALRKLLDYARKHGFGRVLEVAAFLSPDQLTLELLDCDRATARRLCKLSLLRHMGGNVYRIHRLHQEAARDGVSPSAAIAVAKKALLSRFDANNSDTWKFGTSMVSHVDSLEKHVEETKQIGSIGLEFDEVDYAGLLHSTALILHYALHEYSGARTKYMKSFEMYRHVYGPDAKNADLASTLGNLGLLESDVGNYEKARKYYEESFEMFRHVYGPNAQNDDLASTLNNLGLLESNVGHYGKARKCYENAFEMYRHVHDPDAKNADLASTLHNLGNLEHSVGNHEKAREYYEESFEMYRDVYGPDAKNADLASTLGNLGLLESDVGNYEKARKYYENAFEMYRHVHGPYANHADLAMAVGNLGDLERKRGKYGKAREHYVESFNMYRHVYGPDAKNDNLAWSLDSFGELEKAVGYYEKAREYYDKAIDMHRHVHGVDANLLYLARAIGHLGGLEHKLGKWNLARTKYNEALDMFAAILGKNAPNHLWVKEVEKNVKDLSALEEQRRRTLERSRVIRVTLVLILSILIHYGLGALTKLGVPSCTPPVFF